MLSRQGIMHALETGDIEIEPFDIKQLGPNSYDLRLGKTIGYYALVGTGVDFPTTSYGLVDREMTPERYGHQAALDPDSPHATCIMTRPIMNLAGRPPIIQREISDDGIMLYPGNVYLALIQESICGKRFVPELTGRSSLARAGVSVELSAPYANLGHKLHYTIEITVTYPTLVYPNMKIAQVFFHQVEEGYNPSYNEYTGKYMEERFDGSEMIASYIPDPELEAHMYRLIQEQVRMNEQIQKEAESTANSNTPTNNEGTAQEETGETSEPANPDSTQTSAPIEFEGFQVLPDTPDTTPI